MNLAKNHNCVQLCPYKMLYSRYQWILLINYATVWHSQDTTLMVHFLPATSKWKCFVYICDIQICGEILEVYIKYICVAVAKELPRIADCSLHTLIQFTSHTHTVHFTHSYSSLHTLIQFTSHTYTVHFTHTHTVHFTHSYSSLHTLIQFTSHTHITPIRYWVFVESEVSASAGCLSV